MNAEEIRNIITSFPKYQGTSRVAPASVCNEGFPGNFNLSFTEAEMIKQYGQYIDYDKDLIYSKIQPVIRYNDFLNYIQELNENSYRYLGIFDLADVGGSISLTDKSKKEEISKFSIDSLYSLLIDVLGLNKKNLRINYFGGGNLEDVTDGKYTFDYEIPADKSIEYWKKHGLAEEQLITDFSRDTFLSLNVYGLPTPWGYRHEINYLHNGKLLDVGTFERLDFKPTFDSQNGELIGINPWVHSWSISAVGIERLLMVINNEKEISNLPHIKPMKEEILKLAKIKDEKIAITTTEAIRVTHRVIADCETYAKLSERRKEKFRTYCKAIIRGFEKLNIDLSQSNLLAIVKLNAELQPYYQELEQVVEQVAKEIISANQRIKLDKSKKHRGVAQ